MDTKLAILKTENNKKTWSLSDKGKNNLLSTKVFCYGPLIIKKLKVWM